MASEKAKVTISLEVKLIVEVTDDGYLGIGETVGKHLHKAKTDAQGWEYFVKRGALNPQPVRAQVKVLGVTIIPEEV